MGNKAVLVMLCAVGLRAHARIDARWFGRNYVKSEHMVPMRDGCRLYTAVYAPVDTMEHHPLLLTRTPYGCHPYGDGAAALWEQDIMEPYLRAGYIMVFQDVRGRHASEGTFENVRPLAAGRRGGRTDEASDTYDTADWLLANVRHNNGRIGVYGNSYSGFYALMAGASGHPAIRAVSPQAPVGDWWAGDDFHHNGALAVMDAVAFLPNFGVAGGGFRQPVEGDMGTYLMTHTVADITAGLGGIVPFWDEMAAHPNYDGWWRARSSVRAARRVTAAVLMAGSTYDAEDAYGFWHIYRELRRHRPGLDVRLAVGAWAHGAWRWNRASGPLEGGVYLREPDAHDFVSRMEFPFFEHYLRDRDVDGAMAPGGAEVYFTGENRWRTMDGWDPDGRHARRELYLTDGGGLSAVPCATDGAASQYVSDPSRPVPYHPDITGGRKSGYMCAPQSFLEGRADVLQFETAALDTALTMAGGITARLYVELSTTDADFVVKLIDCGPEGDMMVRGEILRGRYRGNPSRPKPFRPGRTECVVWQMPDVAHTFLPGHRIRIQIQSTWFPLFDLNPQCFRDIYTATQADFTPCRVTVRHDRKHPSSIIFYVL